MATKKKKPAAKAPVKAAPKKAPVKKAAPAKPAAKTAKAAVAKKPAAKPAVQAKAKAAPPAKTADKNKSAKAAPTKTANAKSAAPAKEDKKKKGAGLNKAEAIAAYKAKTVTITVLDAIKEVGTKPIGKAAASGDEDDDDFENEFGSADYQEFTDEDGPEVFVADPAEAEEEEADKGSNAKFFDEYDPEEETENVEASGGYGWGYNDAFDNPEEENFDDSDEDERYAFGADNDE